MRQITKECLGTNLGSVVDVVPGAWDESGCGERSACDEKEGSCFQHVSVTHLNILNLWLLLVKAEAEKKVAFPGFPLSVRSVLEST